MTRIRFFALVLICAAVCPAQLMRLAIADVKPDHIGEFADLQKKVTAAYQKAGVEYRAFYVPSGIGDQTRVYSFIPMDKFAEIDAPVLRKAMGDTAYAAYLHRARECVTSVSYEVVERVASLTIDEGPRPGGLYAVSRIQVKPGHEAAFEAKVQTLIPALKKAGVKTFLASRVQMGGPMGLYRFGRAIADFAALDNGPLLERALGKEGAAKFRESLSGDVVSWTNEVYRLDPDLSFRR